MGKLKKNENILQIFLSTYITQLSAECPRSQDKRAGNLKKAFYRSLPDIFYTYPDLKEFFRLLKGLLSTSLSEFFRLLKGLCCIETTGLLSTSLSACLRLLGLSKIRSIHGMKCVTLATRYFQKT